MKVYLVDEHYYDDYAIHGIFSSYEKALEYVRTTSSRLYFPLDEDNINEYTLDETS